MGKPSASNIIAKSQSTQEEIAKGFADVRKSMSALPPKADMCGAIGDVRFGPIADIGRAEFEFGCIGLTEPRTQLATRANQETSNSAHARISS